MGLLDRSFGSNQSVQRQSYEKSDFEGGLIITEIVNGKRMEADRVVLLGSFMPTNEFPFGGKQRIVKEHYAGSQDPTIQVMGPAEDDVSISGVLKEKKLSSELKGASQEYQELIDAMRIRGNLVEIVLGEWKRYGFIESSTFKMKRVSHIEYTINFIIAGFNIPKNYYLVDGFDGDLVTPNKELTNKVLAFQTMQQNMSTNFPRTLTDNLNSAISGIAKSITSVTSFVDGILDDADRLKASAERAIGVIRNSRVFLARTTRRVNSIPSSATSIVVGGASETEKLVNEINLNATLGNISKLNMETAKMLASLQRKFESVLNIKADSFHLVKQGDTLQKISVKKYGSSDKWTEIKDLNKLRTTELVPGTLLKIPK